MFLKEKFIYKKMKTKAATVHFYYKLENILISASSVRFFHPHTQNNIRCSECTLHLSRLKISGIVRLRQWQFNRIFCYVLQIMLPNQKRVILPTPEPLLQGNVCDGSIYCVEVWYSQHRQYLMTVVWRRSRFLSVRLRFNLIKVRPLFRYRIEDLITPHYLSCLSVLIILTNQLWLLCVWRYFGSFDLLTFWSE